MNLQQGENIHKSQQFWDPDPFPLLSSFTCIDAQGVHHRIWYHSTSDGLVKFGERLYDKYSIVEQPNIQHCILTILAVYYGKFLYPTHIIIVMILSLYQP